MHDFAVLFVMVLLPLVPAFLLFQFLSSQALVTGPLMGFSIKLGGAAGGYFAIFLTLLWAFHSLLPGSFSAWELRGRVVAQGMDGPPSLTSFYLVPGLNFHTSDGTFVMIVYAPNSASLPELQVVAAGYVTAYQDLRTIAADQGGHVIDLKDITLRKPPPLPLQHQPALPEKPAQQEQPRKEGP